MKEIQISDGFVAQVDDDDYDMVSKHKWRIQMNTNKPYAVAQIYMHRLISNVEIDKVLDHADGNSLNNTKSNFRIATKSQNRQSSKKQKNTSSKYKGVYWNKKSKKWQCTIAYGGKSFYLGSYENEDDAGRAYDVEAKINFGEFANLNFKD